MYPVITIDGQSGSGKGTLAYRLAKRLGFNLLDSGALYRIVGLMAYKNGILTDEIIKTKQYGATFIDEITQLTKRLRIDFVVNQDTQAIDVLLDNQPLMDDIRNETVGGYASIVAGVLGVRSALLAIQQDTAKRAGVVADGRDMGTVVFPNACAKLFLVASPKAKATRRVGQLLQAGKRAEFDEILADIEARDVQDESRAISPSRPADDALVIDTSDLTADDVYERALAFVLTKMANKK